MKKVCLQFETVLQLLDFLEMMALTKFQLDRISNIIICELNEADVELAMRTYHAKQLRAQFA